MRSPLAGILCLWCVVGRWAPAEAAPPEWARLCGPCHGPEGRGDGPAAHLYWPPPTDLIKAPLKLARDRQGMAQIIAVGMPGTGMPAFGEHLDVTPIIDWISAQRAEPLEAGSGLRERGEVSGGDPARGAQRWAEGGCGACHRDGLSAAQRPQNDDELPADTYDLLTQPLKGSALAGEAAAIYAALRDGRPGTPMRPQAQLDEIARRDLVAWIVSARAARSLGPARTPPAGYSAPRHPSRIWAEPDGVGAPDPEGLPILSDPTAARCGRCHRDTYTQWRESRHALAGGLGVEGQYIGAEREWAEGCVECHSPAVGQRIRGPANTAERRQRRRSEGVTCAGCHLRGGVKQAPSVSGAAPAAMQVAAAPEMARSDFCLPCHNLPLSVAVDGSPLLDTWREWAASPYLPGGVQCQHCHMPQGDHRWLGAHAPDAVAQAIELDLQIEGDQLIVALTNVGAGHHWPTTATPRGVIRVRRLDKTGEIVPGSERLWAVGRTLRHRGGRWQTVADTRIPAGETRRWRYGLAEGGAMAEVEVWFYPDWLYSRFFRARLDDPRPERRRAFKAAAEAASGRRFRVVHRRLPLGDLQGGEAEAGGL